MPHLPIRPSRPFHNQQDGQDCPSAKIRNAVDAAPFTHHTLSFCIAVASTSWLIVDTQNQQNSAAGFYFLVCAFFGRNIT